LRIFALFLDGGEKESWLNLYYAQIVQERFLYTDLIVHIADDSIVFLTFAWLKVWKRKPPYKSVIKKLLSRQLVEQRILQSDTPRRAGGLMSGAASKAVTRVCNL
jgi:hypothetical protein